MVDLQRPLTDPSGTVYAEKIGNLELHVHTGRDWCVLTRLHNGTRNSLGYASAEIPAALALLRTAADWLADQYGDGNGH